MSFLWKGKGIAIKVLIGPKEVYLGGGLAQIGWAMFRGKILVLGQDPWKGWIILGVLPL